MNQYTLGIILPVPPLLPEPEPPVIQVCYDYEQLKGYRLRSQPYIVRANYDIVQMMIEDGILEKRVRDYIEWLNWVKVNM
jgi:hypothetical protein